MDEDIHQEITQVCIALLHKNAATRQQTPTPLTSGSSCAWPSHQDGTSTEPKTKKEAIAWLLKGANEPGIPFNQVIDALEIIANKSRPSSQTHRWAVQLLLDLARREEIAPGDALNAAATVCALEPQNSQEQQEAVQILLALARRRDISFSDAVEAAYQLYIQSPKGSQARELGAQMLLTQARWPDVTIAQAQEAALALAQARGRGMLSKDWNQAIQVLIELAHHPDLSFEDAMILDDQRISIDSNKALVKQQLTAKMHMWEAVAQRSDLTSAQRLEVAQTLQEYTHHLQLKTENGHIGR